MKVFLLRLLWLAGTLALLLLGSPTVSFAETFIAFGPVQYSRDNGKPTPVTKTFNVLDLSATFTVRIDSAGVSSAIVTLNGVDVFKESDFNQTVKVLTRAVTLLATNQLTVELRGKPGETMTVRIDGTVAAVDRTLGATFVSPRTLAVGQASLITVSVSIPDPTVIAGSVDLLRLDSAGNTTVVGILHDDGNNGDILAGDGIFTYQATLNESAVGQIHFQVSATFQGSLLPVLADVLPVFVQPSNAPSAAVSDLSAELASGNINAALLRFLESDKANAVLKNLSTAGQQRLANAFAGAQLMSSVPDLRVYHAPLTAPNGHILSLEFTLGPNNNGDWVVIAW